MKNRKGQSAMEYLMTYGWAIIIVIIVGVVLWKLNIFTPSAPKTSGGFDTFSVGTNFRIGSDGSATLIVVNADKQGRSVTLNSAKIASGANCNGAAGSKNSGDNWTITCTAVPGVGAKGKPYTGVTVDLNYTTEGLTLSESGTLTGKYE